MDNKKTKSTGGQPRAPEESSDTTTSAGGDKAEETDTSVEALEVEVEELLTLTDNELIEAEASESLEETTGGPDDPTTAVHSDDCSSCDGSDVDHERQIEEILRNLNEQNSRNDMTAFSVRAGITTLLHPSQMAQILMQLGYEPFPPRRSVTLLGRPCLLLPSTAGYLRYIYQVDGVQGVFRGLTPRIAQQLLFTYVFDSMRCCFRRMHVNSLIAKAKAKDAAMVAAGASGGGDDSTLSTRQVDESEQSESGSVGFLDHFRDVFHDLGSKLVGIVVSYPLHVVVVRTIAQFVGQEYAFRHGFLGEIVAIYKDFGVLGFYRGIIPKLVGETCQTLAVGALAFLVSNQAPAAEVRSLLNVSFSILVSAWTYQFSVVSTTMAVNGSCLQVGRPPMQKMYENWVHCWRDLAKLNVLNRGSSIICRYYTGPTLLVNGVKEPYGVFFGPNHLIPMQFQLK